jgi:cyclopropane fatty-acyl-phospholipid synthase-like methyltransferase
MIDTLPTPSRSELMGTLATPAARFALLDRLKIGYRPLISPLHAVLVRIPAGGRLFDIGCGSGTLLHLALKHRDCAAAHGYDVSAHAVGNAHLLGEGNDRFRVEHRDPAAPLPDLSGYDAVTMIDVFHHLPRDRQDDFLGRVAAALPPGARFIIADIDAARPLGRALNQIHDMVLSREWVHPRAAATTAAMLRDHGLEVEAPDHIRSLWYPHYLIVARRPAGGRP